MLTSAGKVLFTGDGSGNFVAFDAVNGKPLWHSRIGNISNAPQTYMLDGTQHVLVAVGDTLYAFVLVLEVPGSQVSARLLGSRFYDRANLRT